MAEVSQVETVSGRASGLALSAQQTAYFEAFGFLRVPGLFRADVGRIEAAFEDVFAALPEEESLRNLDTEGYDEAFGTRARLDSHHHLNFGGHRAMVGEFIDRHDTLRALRSDPRVVGVVTSLLGEGYEFAGSDGNLLDCDTSWHCDVYGSPVDQLHVKLFFYLDALDARSGALRVIPGTHQFQSKFARRLRRDLDQWERIESTFGVPYDEIPSWTIVNEPGDLIVGNFRMIHATFGGKPRRRLFTLNFREAGEDARS